MRHFLTKRLIMRLSLLLAAAVAGGVLLGRPPWGSSGQPAAARSAIVGSRPLPVEVWQLGGAGPERIEHRYSGLVIPKRTSRLGVKQLGRIEQLAVRVGERVEAGQRLVQLDSSQLQAQRQLVAAQLAESRALLEELERGARPQELMQAEADVAQVEARLALARATLERSQRLRQSSSLSQQELDEHRFQVAALAAELVSDQQTLALLREGARHERLAAQRAVVAAAEARLEELEVLIRETDIVAPYPAVVSERLVDEGAIVSPGQTILEIVEVDSIEVHVGLPNRLAQSLLGQRVPIEVGGHRGYGLAERISPVVDRQSRTQELIIQLQRHEWPELAVGDAVRVVVASDPHADGWWVPLDALSSATRGLWELYLLETDAEREPLSDADERLVRCQVELLRNYGGWAEIRGPLRDGQWIVVGGGQRVTPGQRVRPRTWQPSEEVSRPAPIPHSASSTLQAEVPR